MHLNWTLSHVAQPCQCGTAFGAAVCLVSVNLSVNLNTWCCAKKVLWLLQKCRRQSMAKAGRGWPCQDKRYLLCRAYAVLYKRQKRPANGRKQGRKFKPGQNLECNKAADSRGAFQGHLHYDSDIEHHPYALYLTLYDLRCALLYTTHNSWHAGPFCLTVHVNKLLPLRQAP